jgi:type II secretory pathway component PulK
MMRSLIPTSARRQGFALLGVLWTVVAFAVLSLGLTRVARQAVATAQNRRDYLRALWRAEACVERTRSVIDMTLAEPQPNDREGSRAWRSLGRIVPAHPLVQAPGCVVLLRSAGERLDLNTVDGETIRRVLAACGIDALHADSLADALLDWRDAGDIARRNGAERDWYVRNRRQAPRNGPFASVAELRLIRGFERATLVDSFFDVEPSRVDVSNVRPEILLALPGMSTETVARIVETRDRSDHVGDLLLLGSRLSRSARESLTVHYPQLARLVTNAPDAWILSATAKSPESRATVEIELRLTRGGARAAVVRRKTRWL